MNTTAKTQVHSPPTYLRGVQASGGVNEYGTVLLLIVCTVIRMELESRHALDDDRNTTRLDMMHIYRCTKS